MTRTSWIYGLLCLYVGLAPLLADALQYWQGRNCGYFMLLILPVEFYLLLAVFLCGGIALWSIGGDFFTRRFPVMKMAGLFVAVAAFAVFMATWHNQPSFFFVGFNDRIKKSITEEQIVQIARSARKCIQSGESMGPEEHSWDASMVERWDKLEKTADLSLLPPRFFVYNRDGTIEFWWGGALTGHWGLRVSEAGSLGRQERDYAFLPISEKIVAFSTD